MSDDAVCPWCGAYSKRACDLEEEMGACPWEESEPELDPDRLREDRDDLTKRHPTTCPARKMR